MCDTVPHCKAHGHMVTAMEYLRVRASIAEFLMPTKIVSKETLG